MNRGHCALVCLAVLLGAGIVHPRVLVRIHEPERLHLQHDLDVVSRRRGEWIDVVVEERCLGQLDHLRTEILIEDIEAYYATRKGEYHDYQVVVDSLSTMADNHSIARLDTIGLSYEGRKILALKISDNVELDEEEPELLFMGLHHAREWPSLEVCLFSADTLLRGYGQDVDVTRAVDSRELWIVPCVNPDGYVYCHDEGHDWRKNRRFFASFGTWGVDLNRNYAGSDDGNPEGTWGSVLSWATTHDATSSLYCGPTPFSEEETKAVRDFVRNHDFLFGISFHTYGEVVMWPWGYTTDVAEDADLLSAIGYEMASRIGRESGDGSYEAQQSVGLYPTCGDYVDWAYGSTLYDAGGNHLGYTVESCASFQPAESALDQIVRENFDGILYICEIADSVADLLVPRVMPPKLDGPDTSLGLSYEMTWFVDNPASSPDYYWLDELSGFTEVTDDAESGTDLWVLDGFQIVAARSHSPTRAFFSNLQFPNEVSVMTTAWSLPVSTDDSLAFWCWHEITWNRDFAYVEVSSNGRRWEMLDHLTGSSDWVRKAYPLSEYSGQSILVRFRYVTDANGQSEGFYVDDIRPTPSFTSATTLDSSIASTSYEVGGHLPGSYWYRVRGHNEERGWGDWSHLERVISVTSIEEDAAPRSPAISFKAYPNPSRDGVLFDFNLPDRCRVSVDIYNVMGARVARLISEEMEKGTHQVAWNDRVPPGTYYCRLNSALGRRTVKVVRMER